MLVFLSEYLFNLKYIHIESEMSFKRLHADSTEVILLKPRGQV